MLNECISLTTKALTIAGSDSSGGAGIQADLRTFAVLGVYGSSVITAITAQNTRGVRETVGVAPEMVEQQLNAVLSDIGAGAVKTGMLYDAPIIEAIADRLKNYKIPYLIIDPVMKSTSGHELLDSAGIEVLRNKLLPLADMITPNVEEASALCGFTINDGADLAKAARVIAMMGPDQVVITGIKRGDRCVEFCYDDQTYYEVEGPWLDTPNTHGTGCSFSAAITAFIAKGMVPRQAIELAKKYVTAGLRYSYEVGAGKGPLNHMAAFFPGHVDDSDILEIRSQAFNGWGEKIGLGKLPVLNVIIGGPLCQGMDYGELTRMAVQNGARLIQLREKEGDTRQLVDLAIKMRRVCHENNAIFVVNDRVDVAVASGADGVHIGQDDLDPRMARALLGPEKIIGVSTGNLNEAEIAVAAGADYLGVGPVYPTISKECKVESCGTDLINEIAKQVPVPVVAIGGITPENTPPVLKAGAAGIAVISAILGDPKPEDVVRRFMQSFHQDK